jgi:1,4-alpha-glucan branching enzyme
VALRSPNINVVFVHNEHRLIVFRRWAEGEEFLIVGSLNNHAFDAPTYTFRADAIPDGCWREIFNSDAEAYGGRNKTNAGRAVHSAAGTFECVVPANAVVAFRREEC